MAEPRGPGTSVPHPPLALDRERLVEELSRSRAQLDEAQAVARMGSWELDVLSSEVEWSRHLYTLLGEDPQTYVAARDRLLEHVHELDRGWVGDLMRGVIAGEGEGEWQYDARIRRPDGVVRWVRSFGRATLAADGTVRQLRGTLQDITEVKDAELQLLDAVILNTMMQVMASTANESATLSDALAIIRSHLLAHDDWGRAVAMDVVTGPGGRPELVPHLPSGADVPAEDLLATDRETAIAQRVLETSETVFDEDSAPRTPSIGFALWLQRRPIVVVVITACSPFERHEMLRGMVTQVADQLSRVAEREAAAAELAAARDAAVQASKAKSQFLATMSHEIRTPMNGVIGLNELLLRTALDPHQRRLAEGMQVAGQTLLGLINDVLDFSKIEAGELELEHVPFELRPVFDRVLEVLAASITDKGLRVALRFAPGVPDQLVGDPTRLGQILSNLLANAVKFTHQGSVDIEVAVEDDGHDSPDEVLLRVEVTDTGVGVDTDDAPRLFEPFRQYDASTTRTFGGSGLGLAICAQLVAALNGEIGVRSRLGEGSTFWFTARLGRYTSPSALPLSPRATTRAIATRSAEVLIVEDNAINQLVAQGLLESLGYSSDCATNGSDAVAMALARRYDAILMDLQMPDMDGYSATRQIRAAEPAGSNVPIIALTAAAVDGERERCVAAGMTDFLTKPVSSEQLSRVLRTAIRHDGSAPQGSDEPEVEAVPVTVDRTRIEELEALGERAREITARAIGNFVERAPIAASELAAAAADQDSQRLRVVAHGLRGSALNLGAQRIAAVCLAIERAPAKDVATIAALLETLEAAVRETTTVFEEHLSAAP